MSDVLLVPECVNCKQELDPRQQAKCGEYCFECWNRGVGEKDEEIARLRAELDTAAYRAARAALAGEGEPARCPKTPGGEQCCLRAGHEGGCKWAGGD